jgi:hypothetical protein
MTKQEKPTAFRLSQVKLNNSFQSSSRRPVDDGKPIFRSQMAVTRGRGNRLLTSEFLDLFIDAPAIASHDEKVCRLQCQT